MSRSTTTRPALGATLAIVAGLGLVKEARGQEAPPVPAPAAPATAVEEIVVTAQKRQERLSDVPLSITAFGASRLEALGVRDIGDLTRLTPGLSGDLVSASQPLFSLRGVSSNDFTIGNDPAVGVFIDDVYAGRSSGAVTDLFDIARVEVVKGPQGSLFGRSTNGGAISIVRNTPGSTFEAIGEAEGGGQSLGQASVILNAPLAEGVDARGSVYYRTQDPFDPSLAGGADYGRVRTAAARLAVSIRLSPDADLLLQGDYQRDRNAAPLYTSRTYNGDFTPDDRQTTANLGKSDQFAQRDVWTGSAKFNWRLAPNLVLTSISAYRGYLADYAEDTDGSPASILNFRQRERQNAWSEEFRLTKSGGALEGFVGGSVYDERLIARNQARYNEDDVCGGVARAQGLPTLGCSDLLGLFTGEEVDYPGSDIDEASASRAHFLNWSVFGDVTWHATSRLEFIAGLRYSQDDKSVTIDTPAVGNLLPALLAGTPALYLQPTAGPLDESRTFGGWQPRGVVRYRFDPDLMGYASIARGYKSGGFNILVPQGGSFSPETVTSYEVGLKGESFSHRLSFDLSGFYYTYDDLQVQILQAVAFTRNAASATGYGLDASATARPLPGLTVTASLGLLHATYDTFSPEPGVSYAGRRLNLAPAASTSLIVDYVRPLNATLDLTLGGTAAYRSQVYFDPSNDPLQRDGPQVLSDLHVGVQAHDGRWGLEVFARNVGDEHYVVSTQVYDAIGVAVATPGQPRLVGVRLRLRT